MKEWQIDR